MNYLKGKRAYLSGPIENDVNPNHNWRDEPKRIMRDDLGVDLFDPFEDPKQQWTKQLNEARDKCDYETMHNIAKNFVRKDLCMVDRSDFLVAQVPYKAPTTGTHHEIINSVNAKKPTILVCPQGKQYASLWYFGFIPHEMIFGSWQEAFNYLKEVDQGKHMTEKRWAFVYGLI